MIPDTYKLPVVLESKIFRATPCEDCDVPGYLVLQAVEQPKVLSRLSPAALEQLGLTLARLEAAILAVTGADHVYILRFSEGLSSVHFHLFPRTPQLASTWTAAAGPADKAINGPYLFAWARVHHHVSDPKLLSNATLKTARDIQQVLADNPMPRIAGCAD